MCVVLVCDIPILAIVKPALYLHCVERSLIWHVACDVTDFVQLSSACNNFMLAYREHYDCNQDDMTVLLTVLINCNI